MSNYSILTSCWLLSLHNNWSTTKILCDISHWHDFLMGWLLLIKKNTLFYSLRNITRISLLLIAMQKSTNTDHLTIIGSNYYSALMVKLLIHAQEWFHWEARCLTKVHPGQCCRIIYCQVIHYCVFACVQASLSQSVRPGEWKKNDRPKSSGSVSPSVAPQFRCKHLVRHHVLLGALLVSTVFQC